MKKVKKKSVLLVYSYRNYTICKCMLSNTRILELLMRYFNIIIQKQFVPERQLKILDVIIEKGKRLVIGKLRIIQLIEVDIQLLIRILINTRNKFRIEKDNRVSKSNYRL